MSNYTVLYLYLYYIIISRWYRMGSKFPNHNLDHTLTFKYFFTCIGTRFGIEWVLSLSSLKALYGL